MDDAKPESTGDRCEGDAVEDARDLIARLARSHGANHPEYATALNQLAMLLITRGDPQAAEPLLREALAVRRESLVRSDPDLATSLSGLGGLLWARGEWEEAECLLREAVEVRRDALGERHPKTVVSRNSLAQLVSVRRGETAGGSPEELPGKERKEAPGIPSPSIASSGLACDSPAEVSGVSPSMEWVAAFETLERTFGDLGSRLDSHGARLREGYLPFGVDLIDSLTEAREGFLRLRRDLETASRFYSVAWPEGGLASLVDVADVLPPLRLAEAEFDGAEASRRGALQVLDRVALLRCPHDLAFAPLAECRKTAGTLRTTLAETQPGRISHIARELSEGRHPLTALLNVLDNDEAAADATWADWYDAVVDAFGEIMAVAVARRRIEPGNL